MCSEKKGCLQFRRLVRKMLTVRGKSSQDGPNKRKVEARVIELLNKTDYSLNVVNRYKENIVHLSAANGCIDVVRCILRDHGEYCLERKNAFGWTPLMHAVRNESTEMVKFLISSGAIINDFSFLGMSTMSLACAISVDMFNLLYGHCPTALEYAAHDDINPLCIAALKNDKKLFFRLIELGLDVRKANAFTHILMKRSTVPEIAILAKTHLNSEDYWDELSDIKDLLADKECPVNNTVDVNSPIPQKNAIELKKGSSLPKIYVEHSKPIMIKVSNHKNLFLNLKSEVDHKPNELISPTLSYMNGAFPLSPNNTFIKEDSPVDMFGKFALDLQEKLNLKKNDSSIQSPITRTDGDSPGSPLVLRRCQNKRPPNLKLRSSSNDSNITLSYTPQFSPTKTPNLPNDANEDNVFDESTPTPPKYRTPPRGIILDPNTTKLMYLLQRFGLKRLIPTFLEQEVDLDLFLTLTDQDLEEIGIESKSERLILLSVINECKGKKLLL